MLTVDLRNPDDDAMTAAEEHLAAFVAGLEKEHGVSGSFERMAKTAVVPFDAGVQELLARTADALGVPCVSAMSAAGARRAGDLGDLPHRHGVRGRGVRRDQPHPASTPTRRRAPTASTCWPTQCSAGEPGAHRCFPAHREPLRRAGKSEYCSGVAAGEAVNV